MATCNDCGREISAEDKANANWHESMGKYYHRMCCPGTTCAICGEAIVDFKGAKRNALMGWQHKSCKPVAISPETRKAEQVALRDEMEEERGWIVRR